MNERAFHQECTGFCRNVAFQDGWGSSWNLGAVWSVHPDGMMYRRIAWISEWCAQKQVRVARFRTASDKWSASVVFSMVRIRYRSCGVIHVVGSFAMRYSAAKAMRGDSGRPADRGRALYEKYRFIADEKAVLLNVGDAEHTLFG